MDHIDKKQLKRLVDAGMHRIPADLVIRNVKVVDVYSGSIRTDAIAVIDGIICGFGEDYKGMEETDGRGMSAVPGLIDAHIHIESSCTTPEEFGRMVVPRGTTTVIADPHEIVNVCGLEGFNYMIRAAEKTELSVRYMMPSCVPATPFEDSGSVVNAFDLQWPMADRHVPGLGEFMNYPGVINGNEEDLNKILVAHSMHKVIDGHSPGLLGDALNAYAAAGIKTDHECSTLEEMKERIERGMYVQLRDGSSCHDLEKLIPGITDHNYRRCLLCSDDRQAETILSEGHVDSHLRKLVSAGIDPVRAICMATLNAAECYQLTDRGGLAPGMRADIVLFDNLKDFHAQTVYIEGKKVAENGHYLLPYQKAAITNVRGSMHVKNFTLGNLKLHLKSPHVKAIEIIPGGVTTKEAHVDVKLGDDGDFIFEPGKDVVKMAVLERHHNTGHIGLGLLKNYGIRDGAVALSVSHDSHNIICVGVSNEEMYCAVHTLIDQEGGFVIVKGGKTIGSLPLPVAGLMSDQSGEWVAEHLRALHDTAFNELGVNRDIDPLMTLCFMALIVIPDLKLTDRGLFDVKKFAFTELEV